VFPISFLFPKDASAIIVEEATVSEIKVGELTNNCALVCKDKKTNK
jgi:hypothetical protein